MITYFPNLISRKAIAFYFITLLIVSVVFFDNVLPFVWMLFGAAEVMLFFYFSNQLSKQWHDMPTSVFTKRLLWTSLGIRLVYMVFVYFFYDYMTGQPFMFHTGDEQLYYNLSGFWREKGWEAFQNEMKWFPISDSGEIYIMAFLNLLFGRWILTTRIAHCLFSALTCVLVYRIAKRHFGDGTGRMAAIFCMLMPNLVYYCGTHLKEVEMVFFTLLLVDSVDVLLGSSKLDWKSFLVALGSSFALFTFRTALGAVGLIAVLVALVLNRGQLTSKWKRIGLAVFVVAAMSMTTIGNRLWLEVSQMMDEGGQNQSVGMEYRSMRVGGNSLAKNASAMVFAPVIFTLPFASMVYTENQENQQMLNGGNFVKNVMSGFTIFGIVLLLLKGDWRKHVLPLTLTVGYLVVMAFSNFAHSERFHQPALPFELMFAAYGISQLQRKHVKWIDYWMIFVMAANVGWAWFKLAGRGLV